MRTMDKKIKNTQIAVRNFWIFIVIISFFTFFIGFRFDTMNVGAAIGFVSIFIFIVGIVMAFIFQKRKKVLDRAIKKNRGAFIFGSFSKRTL